jgi:hypothetical protein
MGKASSSKKVARAAKAAGRPGAGRQWGWPLAIVGLVVVGLLLILVSRGNNEESTPPILGDHWHTAYGIYNCDTFVPPLSDQVADATGLHTHEDSLMHIHPFSTAYTGDRATIGAWGETTGLELTNTSIDAASVHVENGDDCADGPGTVQVMKWDSIADEEGELLDGDLADYAMQDGEILTIAFVAEGTEIPKPDESVLATLQAPPDVTGQPAPTVLDPDASTSTTAEGDGSSTTLPAEDPATSDTTTPSGTTDSTAPTETSDTTAAP